MGSRVWGLTGGEVRSLLQSLLSSGFITSVGYFYSELLGQLPSWGIGKVRSITVCSCTCEHSLDRLDEIVIGKARYKVEQLYH